jgi:diaminopimelate decarboxylase
MDDFDYRDGELFVEEVPVREIAERHGTPVYVYSAKTAREHLDRIREAFAAVDPLVCYSVKANGNLAVLRMLRERGSGFDVVSGGELTRALRAGADPATIVFAGVGKTAEEIRAALEAGILMFNVESEAELDAIEREAEALGRRAPVALRINPSVDPKTHRYIATGRPETKFGLDLERADRAAGSLVGRDHLELVGIHLHIGSQITDVAPYVEAMEKAVEFVRACRDRGLPVEWLNIGGGFGIFYRDEGEARSAAEFGEALVPVLERARVRVALEPGRFVIGNAGILLTRVLYRKQSGEKRFVIVDAGMNDLLRPSLYEAYHRVWPVMTEYGARHGTPGTSEDSDRSDAPPTVLSDVVGPICESGDFLAKDRQLPEVTEGDLLAVFSAGAYGFTMASNYNGRPRPPEVLVDGDEARLVRRRETMEDLLGPEIGLDED